MPHGRRKSTQWLGALALAFACAVTLAGGARPATAQSETVGPPRRLRLALSKSAIQVLSESRIRRLVASELEGVADVAPEPVGPLDEDVVRVFVDLKDGTLIVQAVAPGRKVEVRRVAVAELEPDIAARFAALATAEAVRAQLSPTRRRPTRPRIPTDAELIAKRERVPTFVLGSDLGAGYRSATSSLLTETSVGLTAHGPVFSERLRLSWSTDVADQPTRAFDVSLALGHRFFLTPHVALFPGVSLGVAHLDLAVGNGTRDAAPNATIGGFGELSIDISRSASFVIGARGNARLLDSPDGARGFDVVGFFGFAHETSL